MAQFLRHYLLALQFFTRIPVTGRLAAWVGFSPAMLQRSLAHFPGVGLLVGGLVASASAALLWALPHNSYAPLVVAALGTAWGVLLTGAFHEDGLADVADGLGGSLDRNRALEIMKDSRVGAFGAIAVVLALLCKVALLAQLAALGWGVLAMALVSGHVVSRTWPLGIVATLPNVSDVAGSKSKPMADRIGTAGLGAALLWGACAFAILAALDGLGVLPGVQGLDVLAILWAGGLLSSACAFWWLHRWFARRLGGYTGDCLGTTQQLCELAYYLGVALAWGVAVSRTA